MVRHTFTVNAAIGAYVKVGGRCRVVYLMAMRSGVGTGQDNITFSAAINACVQGGLAYGFVEQCTISYSDAILACEKGGDWPRVNGVTQLACVFVARISVTCNAAYSAGGKALVWLPKILELLGVMADECAEQYNVTYSAARVQAGAWLGASTTAGMGDERNTITFIAAVIYIGWVQTSVWSWVWLPWPGGAPQAGCLPVQPVVTTFSTAVGACRLSGGWVCALAQAGLLVGTGPGMWSRWGQPLALWCGSCWWRRRWPARPRRRMQARLLRRMRVLHCGTGGQGFLACLVRACSRCS